MKKLAFTGGGSAGHVIPNLAIIDEILQNGEADVCYFGGNGIEKNLVTLLGEFAKIPITYAGGVGSYEDIELLNHLGKGKIDVTIGSALDLFGGTIEYDRVKWL